MLDILSGGETTGVSIVLLDVGVGHGLMLEIGSHGVEW